jgi:hypothetical protein
VLFNGCNPANKLKASRAENTVNYSGKFRGEMMRLATLTHLNVSVAKRRPQQRQSI